MTCSTGGLDIGEKENRFDHNRYDVARPFVVDTSRGNPHSC